MNVVEAVRHPDLFGRLGRFRSLDSWGGWIVALKVLFALPLDDEEFALYTACTGRTEAPAEEATEAAFVIGRRGGKSWMAAVLAVFTALLNDWRPYLAPGEQATIALIGQNTRAATRALFSYVKGIVAAVPVFAREVAEERADELVFRNQSVISVWPSSYRSVRGLTLAGAFGDECDFWWASDSANSVEEVVTALRPGLASLPGARLVMLSSPYVSGGWLHDFHERHWGQPGRRLAWRAPSRTMNPTLDEAKIAALIAEDPERLSAEFEATWRSGLQAAFDAALVDAAVRSEPLVAPPRFREEVAAG